MIRDLALCLLACWSLPFLAVGALWLVHRHTEPKE